MDFTINYFSDKNIVDYYLQASKNIGLWKSEKQLINKYTQKESFILDIGCGAGRVSFGLYKQGYRNLYGIDLSLDMINQANILNLELNYNVNFSCQNAKNMNFPDDYFDLVVFSFNGFCTIPTYEQRYKVTSEINRVLKNNGIFLFSADSQRMNLKYKKHWNKELEKWAKNIQDQRFYDFGDCIFQDNNLDVFFHFFSKDELIEMLNKSGFKLINNISLKKFKEKKETLEFCPYGMFWIAQKV